MDDRRRFYDPRQQHAMHPSHSPSATRSVYGSPEGHYRSVPAQQQQQQHWRGGDVGAAPPPLPALRASSGAVGGGSSSSSIHRSPHASHRRSSPPPSTHSSAPFHTSPHRHGRPQYEYAGYEHDYDYDYPPQRRHPAYEEEQQHQHQHQQRYAAAATPIPPSSRHVTVAAPPPPSSHSSAHVHDHRRYDDYQDERAAAAYRSERNWAPPTSHPTHHIPVAQHQVQPSYRRSYLPPANDDRHHGHPASHPSTIDEQPRMARSPSPPPPVTSKPSMSISSLLGTSREPERASASVVSRQASPPPYDQRASNQHTAAAANGHRADRTASSRFYSDSPSPPPQQPVQSEPRRSGGASSISNLLDNGVGNTSSTRSSARLHKKESPTRPHASAAEQVDARQPTSSPESTRNVAANTKDALRSRNSLADEDDALLSTIEDVKPSTARAPHAPESNGAAAIEDVSPNGISDATPQRRGSQRVKLRNQSIALAKAARKKTEDDFDSDLSAEENRPVWTAELKAYEAQWADRLACIEEAYEAGLLDKERTVGKRLSRGYRTRYVPIIARVKSREEQERRQREIRQKQKRDVARKQREREVEMELLGTLDDSDMRGRGKSSKGKAGRASGAARMDVDDDIAHELLGSSDEEYANMSFKKRRTTDLGALQAAEELESMLESRASSPVSIVQEEDTNLGSGPMTERREKALADAHRKIWTNIARRDVPRVYRIVQAGVTNKQTYWRRLSGVVAREAKRGASRGNKTVKDQQQRSRKLMREMLVFWRRNEKEERELRKKAEKEALEKAKKEEEMREAKRQARKLNFLITQTELYSHFVGNKLKTKEAEESEETSGANKTIDATPDPHADATVPPFEGKSADAEVTEAEARLAELKEIDFDDEDESNLRAHARRNAEEAVAAAKAKATAFDKRAAEERKRVQEELAENGEGEASGGKRIEEKDLGKAFDQDDMNFLNPTSMGEMDVKQPKMLTCQLKEYQLKGLNWLANLYEQGINGILADEMGLGKTVQSIALMAYLAEVHDIWGPFLVIAPASTLHNWQQEISRFVPSLKALPYWGNVKDRAVLRKFWNRKQISYHRDAPFHVLITSYQLVVSDEKYFQRVKWQYMVLDEAQAIKSSSSIRWKTLLGFDCRNRLLLTGTPVQNSMQELWALLHFIMPSLFDSHDEFSEWFSKDIESHAENKGTLNEHQLRRLHMILKPFMLRRIKKNVQNELGDKIEIDVYCDMSARQRALYRGLKARVSVAELMDKAQSNDEAGLKSLMNLVMQFRKVCNHPELFERADVESPWAFAKFAQSGNLAREGDLLSCGDSTASLIQYEVPKLICRDGGLLDVPGANSRKGFDTKYLTNLMNVWRAWNVHESLRDTKQKSAFSFVPLLDLSASDVEDTMHGSHSSRIVKAISREVERQERAPFYHDDEFAASSLRPIGEISRPIPTNSGESPSLITPLDGVASAYHSGSFLAKRSAMQLVTPVVAPPIQLVSSDGPMTRSQNDLARDEAVSKLLYGLAPSERESELALEHVRERLPNIPPNGLLSQSGVDQMPASEMQVPQMNKLIIDSSKLSKLDELLRELKAGGHRVLIYFQMTRMIDLMEEYLVYKQYKYLRLDGSSKISERRDMVTDWQTRPELFIFLLSTRAGGLGINLTAADTVIFYDHDWNPSNDSQAMDRAHRLGQTKQVTVYRLITKNTIDERIVKLARNKKEVQDIVVGSKAYSETGMAKPQEIVSLLLDDEQLAETMLRRKQDEERTQYEGKAAMMRSNVAKRKAREAAAAASLAVGSPSATPTWTLDEDEDDFFGAKLPSKKNGEEADADGGASEAPLKKKGKPGRKPKGFDTSTSKKKGPAKGSTAVAKRGGGGDGEVDDSGMLLDEMADES